MVVFRTTSSFTSKFHHQTRRTTEQALLRRSPAGTAHYIMNFAFSATEKTKTYSPMLKLLFFVLFVVTGCAGGPTHTYYNPAIVGAKFNGPITMAFVDNVELEKQSLLGRGWKVIGSTDYSGTHPQAVELKAQAKRVGANHVIYSSRFFPAPPGSWSFSFNRFGGGGGTGGGYNEVHIVFLGGPPP